MPVSYLADSIRGHRIQGEILFPQTVKETDRLLCGLLASRVSHEKSNARLGIPFPEFHVLLFLGFIPSFRERMSAF